MYVEDDENLDALLLLFIKYIYIVALCPYAGFVVPF